MASAEDCSPITRQSGTGLICKKKEERNDKNKKLRRRKKEKKDKQKEKDIGCELAHGGQKQR